MLDDLRWRYCPAKRHSAHCCNAVRTQLAARRPEVALVRGNPTLATESVVEEIETNPANQHLVAFPSLSFDIQLLLSSFLHFSLSPDTKKQKAVLAMKNMKK